MIITEIQYFFSKIIRFQAIFKDTVEFTCALEFKISSQHPYLHRVYGDAVDFDIAIQFNDKARSAVDQLRGNNHFFSLSVN